MRLLAVAVSLGGTLAFGQPSHPGHVLFVDVEGTEHEEPIENVPEDVAWASVGARRIPVVRVVMHTIEPAVGASFAKIEIVRYDDRGAPVDWTIGVTSSDPAPPGEPRLE